MGSDQFHSNKRDAHSQIEHMVSPDQSNGGPISYYRKNCLGPIYKTDIYF